MNLKEYQKSALRTESIVEQIEFNEVFVTSLLKLFSLSGEALDTIKKDVYYKNPKKLEENMLKYLRQIELTLRVAQQAYSQKDNKKPIKINPRVFHGIIGMATEAGELVEALQRGISNEGVIDAINIHEEIHDSSWYQAILHDALNLDWEQGLDNNIHKLKVRYPEKFTIENADVRNLEEERLALESNIVNPYIEHGIGIQPITSPTGEIFKLKSPGVTVIEGSFTEETSFRELSASEMAELGIEKQEPFQIGEGLYDIDTVGMLEDLAYFEAKVKRNPNDEKAKRQYEHVKSSLEATGTTPVVEE